MSKSIMASVIALFALFTWQLVLAEDKEAFSRKVFTDEDLISLEGAEKKEVEIEAQRKGEIEEKLQVWEDKRQPRLSEFKATMKEVGRFQFQSIELTSGTSRKAVVIIDTKEGHLWLWDILTPYPSLIYGGQLCPGEYMGEKIEYSIK